MSSSVLELEFESIWNSLYPEIDLYPEQRIIPNRRFRFDYVNFNAKVAIEINGQIWHKGGHSSGNGLIRDYQKNNLAIAHGFVVFQLSSEMIENDWLKIIAQTIQERERQFKITAY